MADLHRLHADDEGVRERGRDEQRRRGAADERLAAGEVPDVGGERGDVERERDDVHVCAVGAK